MVLGVAVPVARFVETVFGGTPVDLDDGGAGGVTDDDVATLPVDPAADLLVVGRQQVQPDGQVRLGHDVLTALAPRLPQSILYVVPDRYDPQRYAHDRVVLDGLATSGRRVFVLEVSAMRAWGADAADAARATVASTLVSTPPATATVLLPEPP